MLPDWQLRAKCSIEKMDPELFDADNPEPAQLLCSGCLVMSECSEWHMQPINVSSYVERISGGSPDSVDDVVYPSGVKAAGRVLRGD